ncbi:hypothetical protein HID58_042579, partial [Brassica napus]
MFTFAWSKIYVPNLARTLAMFIGIAIWVTSTPYFRRKKFEIFLYTHQCYGLYIIFYVFHVGDSWLCMILPNISSEIIFQSQNLTTKLPDLLLVCSFKHYQDLSLLDLIFPPSGISVSDIFKLKLQIEAYVTRDNEPQTTTSADGNHVKTKWFKPNNKIHPSHILLWLGVVILTSFTMFLLLIAIVRRYYMYPVDRTGNVYNFTYRSLWDMFLGCLCIFIAAKRHKLLDAIIFSVLMPHIESLFSHRANKINDINNVYADQNPPRRLGYRYVDIVHEEFGVFVNYRKEQRDQKDGRGQ